MGFNSGFKGLIQRAICSIGDKRTLLAELFKVRELRT